jgi:hypothetical protein
MNERIKELMLEAGYAAPELAERANKLVELIIRDVIQEVEEANIKHCCGTTYDLGVANCAQDKIAEHIKKHYNIKTVYGVYK